MKSLKHYLFIIAISLIPFVSIFADNRMLHSHDGPVHLARIAAYYKALGDGQILPRWAGELNYSYGMPLFNFYYHLPYLITSLFTWLGMGLVLNFKINLLIGYIFSGIFMLLFTKKFFKNDSQALFATILYQLAPFHLVDLIVRGDIGEVMIFAFLPLLLYAIQWGFENKTKKYTVAGISLSCAFMLLSHTAVGLLFFGIAVFFVLFFAPSKEKKIESFVGLGVGLLLTAFYWIPILAERKYTYGDLFMKDMYKTHFVPLLHFFIPNLTNTPKLQTGGVDISFGLVQVIALIVGIRYLNKNKIFLFIYTLFFGSLFFMQPVSKIIWENFSILRAYQFPWRFLTIPVFALSLLGPLLFTKKVPLFITMTILASIIYWYPPLGFDSVDEAYYWDYPMNTTYFGETDLIWSAGQVGTIPAHPYEFIAGSGEIITRNKTGIVHEFTVIASQSATIVDHTQYYPGWRVFINGEKTPIEFQDQNWRGQITFAVPAGTSEVSVIFGESKVRGTAEIISLLTIAILSLWLLIWNKKKKN